jgi:hypothetical protein
MINHETATLTKKEDDGGSTENYLDNQELQDYEGLSRGDKVTIKKVAIKEGKSSSVPVGQTIQGSLSKDISVDRSVAFENGAKTSRIKNIKRKDDKLYLETNTSIYELTGEIIRRLDNQDLRRVGCLDEGCSVELEKTKIKEGRSSSIPAGTSISGNLSRDVKLIQPVEFAAGGHTSKVAGVKEKEGELYLETKTSIYRVSKESKKDQTTESAIRKIKENKSDFPPHIQDVVDEYGSAFELSEEIDDKLFVFSESRKDKAIALVQDESGDWHTRAFHHSGSGNQWKAVPAVSPRGRHLKGNESDENHHYVQSGKLDKEVYRALDSTSSKEKQDFDINLAVPFGGKRGADYWMDLEATSSFSEENIEFDDDRWQLQKETLQRDFDFFIDASNAERFQNNTNELLAQLYEKVDNDLETWTEFIQQYQETKGKSEFQRRRKLGRLYKKSLQEYMKKRRQEINRELAESGMVPEFEKSNLHDTYTKNEGKQEITVHEFTAESSRGDQIVWAMASDNTGRVYIDNIYPKEATADSYGTHAPKCNMGLLVYKPTDYTKQTIGIPEEDRDDSIAGKYTDISEYWKKFSPVQKYKEFLEG